MSNDSSNSQRAISWNSRKIILIVLAITILLVAILATVTSSKPSSGTKYMNLSPDDTLNIAKARLASSSDALDGSGVLTADICVALGKLAKAYNPSADYISCKNPESLYLSTPDTADAKLLTLSDESYTAQFKMNDDSSVLESYTFLDQKSAGFNKFGGRN